MRDGKHISACKRAKWTPPVDIECAAASRKTVGKGHRPFSTSSIGLLKQADFLLELSLSLLGGEDDYFIKLDKGLGDATIDGQSMSDDSIFGTGDNRINIDGGIGSIDIDFKEDILS